MAPNAQVKLNHDIRSRKPCLDVPVRALDRLDLVRPPGKQGWSPGGDRVSGGEDVANRLIGDVDQVSGILREAGCRGNR